MWSQIIDNIGNKLFLMLNDSVCEPQTVPTAQKQYRLGKNVFGGCDFIHPIRCRCLFVLFIMNLNRSLGIYNIDLSCLISRHL